MRMRAGKASAKIRRGQALFCYNFNAMSGHSKWATIHRQKETQDVRRGLLFSKLGRAITLAARAGGGNPQTNIRLRFAIDAARNINMPKENIERAIQKAIGGEEEVFEEVKYEGYGPEGVAVIVDAATNNKNRTAQEIKNIFERGGGTLGGPGSVSFNFSQVGLLLIQKGQNPQGEMLRLIDLGVEDVEETPDGIEVYVKPADVGQVKTELGQAGFSVLRADLAARPKNFVTVTEPEKAKKVLSFLEKLNAHDDVQKIFANVDIPNEVLASI